MCAKNAPVDVEPRLEPKNTRWKRSDEAVWTNFARAAVGDENTFAKFVARLDVAVRGGRINSREFELSPVDATVPEDPDVAFVLDEYQQELNRSLDLNVVITNASDRLRRFGDFGGDSQLGDFVAEAMPFRPFVETDFCVTSIWPTAAL